MANTVAKLVEGPTTLIERGYHLFDDELGTLDEPGKCLRCGRSFHEHVEWLATFVKTEPKVQ